MQCNWYLSEFVALHFDTCRFDIVRQSPAQLFTESRLDLPSHRGRQHRSSRQGKDKGKTPDLQEAPELSNHMNEDTEDLYTIGVQLLAVRISCRHDTLRARVQ